MSDFACSCGWACCMERAACQTEHATSSVASKFRLSAPRRWRQRDSEKVLSSASSQHSPSRSTGWCCSVAVHTLIVARCWLATVCMRRCGGGEPIRRHAPRKLAALPRPLPSGLSCSMTVHCLYFLGTLWCGTGKTFLIKQACILMQRSLTRSHPGECSGLKWMALATFHMVFALEG